MKWNVQCEGKNKEKLLCRSSALTAACVCVFACVKQMPFCWSQFTSIRLQPKSSRKAGGASRLPLRLMPLQVRRCPNRLKSSLGSGPTPDEEHLPTKDSQAAVETTSTVRLCFFCHAVSSTVWNVDGRVCAPDLAVLQWDLWEVELWEMGST